MCRQSPGILDKTADNLIWIYDASQNVPDRENKTVINWMAVHQL